MSGMGQKRSFSRSPLSASSGLSDCQRLGSQQASLCEPLPDPVNICLDLEGKPADMLLERIFRVDSLKLFPDPSGFFNFADMPEGGRKVCTRKVRFRDKNNALPEIGARR